MASYIIRRLLLMMPTLLGMTIVVFCVMAMSPGGLNAIVANHEGAVDPKQRMAVRKYYEEKYGLDKPLPLQYLHWLNKVSFIGIKPAGQGWPASMPFGFKVPDLGDSIQARRPVLDMIEESLPITLLLNVISTPIMLGISMWSGIAAARKRGKTFDVASGTFQLGLWSIPQIWACVLLIGYLANKNMLFWFPTSGLHDLRADDMAFLPSLMGGFHRGWLLDACWHLVLPLICYTYVGFAFATKITRGAMLESMNSDFVRTARAKGVGERQILFRHVLRNSLMPVITTWASLLPSFISGSIVVESAFGIPGMGRLAVDAVFEKDPELVLSTTLVAGLLGLVSFLLADMAYAIADPRVSYEAEAT